MPSTNASRTPAATPQPIASFAFGAGRLALAALALLVGSTTTAHADDWRFSVTPYLWATDVGVDVTIDDRTVVDREIAFTDLLEDLDSAAQIHFEAQRGAHGLMLDLFDVRLSGSDDPALPGGEGGSAHLASEIGMTLVEAGGLWDPQGDQRGFALLYGARILDQRAEVDGTFTTAGGTTGGRWEDDETLVDALVGARYTWRLSPRWTAQARVDASAGGTDLTWSGATALAWSFGRDGRYAVTAGYRYLTVDFADDDALDADMTLYGFGVGLRAAF